MESTAPNRRQQIAALLKRYWGFDTFRPVQEQVILSVLAGRDTLALMPTGGGKSLTYQIPGLASEGVCIVVTPLIALMKDQVDRLRKLGIRALAIHSGLSARQIDIDLDNCVYGDVKFLYVAPERLASEAFRLRVQRMNVSLLAVDEAHCISQWGYDFRPSYLRIAELRERIPGVPVLALTASATPRVADDIMEKLRFAEPHLLRSDFSRPNLSYAVRHTDDKNEQLLRIIRNVGGSGIVYVRTREGAEQVAAFLRDEGISAEYYHGGLGHAERSMRQEAWISGRTPVMVATNAFGMGIDKPDVRYVVHYTMCDSLESYYQEAGRAGRDGRRSYAVLLISSDDAERIAKRFEADYPPLEKIRSIYEKICSYLQIAIGDGAQSSFLFNLRDFCTREHLYTGLVQNALKDPESERLHDPHGRSGQPRAHPLLRQPRRSLPPAAAGTRPTGRAQAGPGRRLAGHRHGGGGRQGQPLLPQRRIPGLHPLHSGPPPAQITLHGLRHTFAKQWIRHGGDIKALQSIFGHKDAMVTLNVYADIEPMSKIQNMLRVLPSLWRGYLGLRVDPGPMFQQKIREAIETLEAFGYGISEPDDRNVLIRDVQTISRLYPTEYAAVLGAIPTEATVVE